MSRRKQSKPRQIKRSMGDLEEGEDNPPDDLSSSGDEGGASDPDDLAECGESSPAFASLYSEEHRTEDSPDPSEGEEEDKGPPQSVDEEREQEEEVEEEVEEEEEEELPWDGPDDLRLANVDGSIKVVASHRLNADTAWGPYAGSVQTEEVGKGPEDEHPGRTLASEDPDCWLHKLPLTSTPTTANCSIYSRGEQLFCKLTREVQQGESLLAVLMRPDVEQTSPVENQNVSVKEESAYPAASLPEFQLLPQQAGMAAILATAVINKDIFPCKDCGIWYRSERNLQAHLMYYCASRQKQAAGSPPQDKPKDSYPNERVCPFSHCRKSCPSASSLEIHMRTHSGERPFVCLICLSAFTTKANCERHLKVHTDTLKGICHGCGFVSTTRDILYSHLVTSHMVCQPGSRSEVYSPGPGLPPLQPAAGKSPMEPGAPPKCQLCGFVADTPSLLQQHVRGHLEAKGPIVARHSPPSAERPDPSATTPRPDSASPGTNGASTAAREGSPSAPAVSPTPVKVKEEPQCDSTSTSEEASGQEGQVKDNSSQTSSPRSPPSVHVKTELPSPTPGSSPVHVGVGGSVIPGGAVFLPQYVFGPEATIMPQASEILAKMSEMVHSRLKQGQGSGGVPAFYAAGSPVQKGATCFECDITFNNVNNFYVHKRLYCSSRHQQGEVAGPAPQGKERTAVPGCPTPYDSPPGPAGSQAPPPPHSDAESEVDTTLVVEVKSEEAALKDPTSSEGESGGRSSEGSQSPGGSVGDTDDDPSRTFCQACNIRFSRHENYIVHKRFYCASRHDPSNQRPHQGKATFLPQPIRTRKRKKMYEIHMAQTKALSGSAAVPVPVPVPALAPTLATKQEPVAPMTRVLEQPALPIRHLSGPSPSPGPEGEGPIDLSKRPRLREAPQVGLPALPLTDYHKCTACSISFNSIENYLAHKTFYCPATTLQQRSLEQLHRLKRSASTSPPTRPPDGPEPCSDHTDSREVKPDSVAMAVSFSTQQPGLARSPSLPAPSGAKAHASPATNLPMVCPYCPPNGAIMGDLMEHFRTAHGLVLTLQPALGRSFSDDGDAARHSEAQSAPVSPTPNLSPKDPPLATPPNLGPPLHRESVNGRVKSEPLSPSSPLVNGSPLGSHKGGISPLGTAPLTVSPVPDAAHSQTPPHGHSQVLPKTALVSPLQNGNTRFCRLCNIKFSSLSTFIAHKKYYCSSHSEEHVK
nr:zinc finger protein ZFPM1 isoform X1 [Paramormyrops kingsleyae]